MSRITFTLIGCFALGFLGQAFAIWQIDPSQWTYGQRAATLLIAVMLAPMVMVGVQLHTEQSHDSIN